MLFQRELGVVPAELCCMVLQSLDAAWNKRAAEALDWIVPVHLIPPTVNGKRCDRRDI